MANFYLPKDSDIALAARGWPSGRRAPSGLPALSELGKEADFIYLFNQETGLRDLANNHSQLTLLSTGYYAPNDIGMGLACSSDKSVLDTDSKRFKTSTGDGNGDFTLVYAGSPKAGSTHNNLVHNRFVSDLFKSVICSANRYYADGSSSSSSLPNAFSVSCYSSGGANARGVWHENSVDGKAHCWVCVRRDGDFSLFRDGLLVATRSHTEVPSVYGTGPAYFSVNGWSTSSSVGNIDAPTNLVAEFEFAISDRKAEDISRDIKALFEPANDTPYLITVPDAGGAPTLSNATATSIGQTTATVGCTVTF